MNLDEVFQMGNDIQVRGDQYGWVNTHIDVRPGMPLQIQGSGSINFCNAANMQWWFTPDGQDGEIARPESLGYSVPGVRHAMLIGRINDHIFPIGSVLRFQAREAGTLMVAHNDTKTVNDNDGAFDVRVVTPVTAAQGQRRAPGSPAFDMHFTGPFGINGQASINLPPWMTNPNPNVTFHKAPAHHSDASHGMVCSEIDVDVFAGIRFHRCAHLQM